MPTCEHLFPRDEGRLLLPRNPAGLLFVNVRVSERFGFAPTLAESSKKSN